MKISEFLLKTVFIFFVFPSLLQAADRSQVVQSKIYSALSSILPRTDFLVVINRTDQLEGAGMSEAVDGSIKMLPGLNVGVDSKGTVVSHNQNDGNYQGAVSVTVIIDENVKNETFQTIQRLMPDFMGGVLDDDEIKLSRGVLRQKPVESTSGAPAINIQNQIPDNKTSTQEHLKFLSLFLVVGGLLIWISSKLLNHNTPASKKMSSNFEPNLSNNKNAHSKTNAESTEIIDFSILDSESVGLFLMKIFKDKKEISTFKSWVELSSSIHQRDVFSKLPAWILDYFQDQEQIEKQSETEQVSYTASEVFHKMALMEQSLKSIEQKEKAFLMWFPAEALRFAPVKTKSSLTENSKRVLWNIRPDLGNFVKIDVIDIDSLMFDLSNKEISDCLNEMKSWSSKTIENDSAKSDSNSQVLRWKSYVDGLTEFSPIESQLNQAKEKLSEDQFQLFYKSVAHLSSPFLFNASDRKDWLRSVNPDDYFWWQSLLNESVSWDLKLDLRPLRYNMFLQSLESKNFESWTEKERKLCSERLLNGFRVYIKTNEISLSNAI